MIAIKLVLRTHKNLRTFLRNSTKPRNSEKSEQTKNASKLNYESVDSSTLPSSIFIFKRHKEEKMNFNHHSTMKSLISFFSTRKNIAESKFEFYASTQLSSSTCSLNDIYCIRLMGLRNNNKKKMWAGMGMEVTQLRILNCSRLLATFLI